MVLWTIELNFTAAVEKKRNEYGSGQLEHVCSEFHIFALRRKLKTTRDIDLFFTPIILVFDAFWLQFLNKPFVECVVIRTLNSMTSKCKNSDELSLQNSFAYVHRISLSFLLQQIMQQSKYRKQSTQLLYVITRKWPMILRLGQNFGTSLFFWILFSNSRKVQNDPSQFMERNCSFSRTTWYSHSKFPVSK